MRYKNNVGPQVRRRRYALGWSQSDLATKLQLAGWDISRSGVSKIEARLSYVDDKALLYLAEVLKIPVQELFPAENARKPPLRVHGEAGNNAILSGTILQPKTGKEIRKINLPLRSSRKSRRPILMINDQPNFLPVLSARRGENTAYIGISELKLDLRNVFEQNR